MSRDQTQAENTLLEYIAMLAVVVFAGVMAYAVRTASETVASVKENHYQQTVVPTTDNEAADASDDEQAQ